METLTTTTTPDEIAFMESILDALQSGEREPVVIITDDDLEEMAQESLGQHLGQNPFLY